MSETQTQPLGISIHQFVTYKSSNVHGGRDESSSRVIEVKMCIEAGMRVRHV